MVCEACVSVSRLAQHLVLCQINHLEYDRLFVTIIEHVRVLTSL